MSGIVINIDPVILRLGGFELRWYGVFIALAAVAALLIAAREAKRKGISPSTIYYGAIWVLVGGVIGARLFHVIDHFGYYAGNPSQILQFQGLAIWGGLAGGGAAAIIYARIKHVPLGRVADAVVPALLVGQIIGRFGCIINGDAYGGATGLPWGFIYVHPNAMISGNLFGVPTHPYPVYEILWNSTALLLVLRLRRYFRTDGMLFLSYLSIYSVGRFVLSFVRQEKIWFWGLQEAQVVAMVVLIAAVAMAIYLSRKPGRSVTAEIAV